MANKKLVLQTGEVFYGSGSGKEVIGEIIFNTSMVGYQEILTDPANYNKIVLMTYTLIGNYGINVKDNESSYIQPSALIMKEYNPNPSNFRSTKAIDELFEEENLPFMYGFDTRMLTKIIREKGVMNAIITDIDVSDEECLRRIKNYQEDSLPVKYVSTKKRWINRAKNAQFNVAILDLGARISLIEAFDDFYCNVAIMPFNSSYEEIMAFKPNGLVIAGGPGNPDLITPSIELVKQFIGKLPIMGISLGMNVLAKAYGATNEKMLFGHHGGNHTAQNVDTLKNEVISQNHAYAVKDISNTGLRVTHINLLDKTIEGIECAKDKVFALQYDPSKEAGPIDYQNIFNKFIDNMKEGLK